MNPPECLTLRHSYTTLLNYCLTYATYSAISSISITGSDVRVTLGSQALIMCSHEEQCNDHCISFSSVFEHHVFMDSAGIKLPRGAFPENSSTFLGFFDLPCKNCNARWQLRGKNTFSFHYRLAWAYCEFQRKACVYMWRPPSESNQHQLLRNWVFPLLFQKPGKHFFKIWNSIYITIISPTMTTNISSSLLDFGKFTLQRPRPNLHSPKKLSKSSS